MDYAFRQTNLHYETIKRKSDKKIEEASNAFDESKATNGADWFKAGHSLDEAPVELRNNIWFVRGFEREKRISIIDEQLYIMGAYFAAKGVLIENIPSNYIDKEAFMFGYYGVKRRKNRM